jgi:hypothetical protein
MAKSNSGPIGTAAQLLISVVGVGAMFALGRMVARVLEKRAEEFSVFPASFDTPVSERIIVISDPLEVYEQARRLDYFDQFLFGVDEFKLINPQNAQLLVAHNGKEYSFSLEVIADQPGEFFGVRIEHDGELYGTCLVRFEQLPGREAGTIVTVSTKTKHEFPSAIQKEIADVVAREIDAYLHNLQDTCEMKIAESVL